MDGNMAQEKVLSKLESLFKEEQWGRIEPKDIGISKFKILDDLFNAIVSEDLIGMTRDTCREHLEQNRDSITAIYLLGLIGYHNDNIEDSLQLRKLIDIFIKAQKWAVVEIISEKILEYGENSVAFRALAISLERLGRAKEAIPVLENLMKIDRFDTEVAKKLASALVAEDQDKGVYYMKVAIEGFIRNKEFDEVVTLWNKLVTYSWEDITFFERIERMLVDAKQQELAATLLKTLWHKYRDEENPDQSIELLKKILIYRPEDNQVRKDLIKLYKTKYGEHSLFEQFLKLSRLNNYKVPVKHAIQDFEKNIVFDKDRYAFHNSWGLGKIIDMDSESIIINFKEKENHRMSIQMALQSLTPIANDHLYVMQYNDPDGVAELFKQDFISFFEMLIKSYSGSIQLPDIKSELIPQYIEEKSWGKWWTKARTQIKKDSRFGISDRNKNLIFWREKPVTYVEELLDKFSKTESFGERLDIAIEFNNNIDEKEGSTVVQFFIDYFTDEVKGNSATRQILSYFILKDLSKYVDPAKLKLDIIHDKTIEFIKTSDELPIISMKISSYDYKKDLVNLIEESREDWPQIVYEMLFETPVRIHKYIINSLIRAHAYNTINSFIDRVITGAKQYPEIFIYVAKNLLTRTWDYEWLDYSRESLIVTYFRLMSELKKIEIDGNRLKNMTIDILTDNEAAIMQDIINNHQIGFVAKLYDLFTTIPYIEESHAEKFLGYIKAKFPDFNEDQLQVSEESWEPEKEQLLVTQEGFDRKKEELEHMVKVQMVNLSRELAKVSEATGDVRENVEYNALMEKQAILEMSISRLDEEMKQANILNSGNISTEKVSIGTKVLFKDVKSGEEKNYIILGPWDADFEKNVLSYRSPIARAILNKKLNEEFTLNMDDGKRHFQITSIEKYL
jgi:transcription elongation factor GreA